MGSLTEMIRWNERRLEELVRKMQLQRLFDEELPVQLNLYRAFDESRHWSLLTQIMKLNTVGIGADRVSATRYLESLKCRAYGAVEYQQPLSLEPARDV